MLDREEIIPLLHSLRQPTFFTRDRGFYRPGLLHSAYCLVYLPHIAWCTLNLGQRTRRNILAASYGIGTFALVLNGGERLCVSGTVA
jgi:hypothetical protein